MTANPKPEAAKLGADELKVLLRRSRGSLKRKPGEKPFAERWAEYKREEKELEEACAAWAVLDYCQRRGIQAAQNENKNQLAEVKSKLTVLNFWGKLLRHAEPDHQTNAQSQIALSDVAGKKWF